MSINLHLEASIVATITISLKKKKRIIKENFNLWQTPTNITNKCLDGNAYELYKEWAALSIEHIKELDVWLEEHKGWKIEWFAL